MHAREHRGTVQRPHRALARVQPRVVRLVQGRRGAPLLVVDDMRPEDYVHVGAGGAEQENANGALFREFLERSNLVAANTHGPYSKSGPTYVDSREGVRTRRDYIGVTANMFLQQKYVVSGTQAIELLCWPCLSCMIA